MYTHVYVFIYTCIRIYIYTHMYIYIYIYTHDVHIAYTYHTTSNIWLAGVEHVSMCIYIHRMQDTCMTLVN